MHIAVALNRTVDLIRHLHQS